MRLIFTSALLCLTGVLLGQGNPLDLSAFIRLREQADRDEALALAMAYRLPVREVQPDGRVIELARFVNGRPLYRITDNVNAAISTRANTLHPGGSAGLSLNGSGVLLGIWDGGSVRTTHQELTGRVVVADGAAVASHATHVGGTMIAAGVSASAKGMAFAANLRSYDWNSDTSEMANAAATFGLVASNHSYSYLSGWSGNYWYGDRLAGHTEDAGFGLYDWSSQVWDQVIATNPYYSAFKSAGNDRGEGPSSQPITHKEWNGSAWIDVTDVRPKDGGTSGYDTLPFQSCAKNVIVIGSVGDVLSYTSPASVGMTSYSGWGPTDDGRIKPDLVANGEGLTSTNSPSDTAYASMSGTSMASPNACGSAALVAQHFKNLNSGANIRNHFLRGLLIHTALEAGTTAGPDYKFGWGLMNVGAACALLTDNASGSGAGSRARPVETKTQGTSNERTFSHAGGPIKVTICWNDAPGDPPAWSVDPTAKMLKYDLDVRVVHVGTNTTFQPWILDPANPSQGATTGDNSRDNVEQVVIESPLPGDYVVQVTNKGTLPVAVDYCLLTDGLGTASPSLQGFSLATSTVVGGNTVGATATLSMAPGTATTVSIVSEDPLRVQGGSIIVSSGQTVGTTSLTTSATATPWTGSVTATLNAVSRSVTLTVNPAVTLEALSLDKLSYVSGPTPLTATVTLSGPAPVETGIALSDDSAVLATPGSVTVPAGASSATTAIGSISVTSLTSATVTASYNGITRSASVELRPSAIASLTVNPTAVTGGQPAQVSVTMDGPADHAQTMTFTTSGSPIVGGSINVPSGSSTGSATVTTKSVQSFYNGSITASYRGISRTATLQVMPTFALQSLLLDKSIVVGGETPVNGTVVTTAYAPSDTSISLVDNCPAVTVPDAVTVASGSRIASFGIATAAVSSTTDVVVTASFMGVSKAAMFSLRPADTPGVQSLVINPTYVTGGNPATATVCLDTSASVSTIVVLTSNGSPIIGTSITVPAGETSASGILNTRTVRSFWTGTVTATANGTSKTATLQVMPAFGLQSLVLDKSVIIAGETPLTGTVVTTAYAPSVTNIDLTDDSENLITPSTVTVPSGQRTSSFGISSLAVSTTTLATVSATYAGITKSTSVTLIPAPVLIGLVVTPTVVQGGTTINGTVTLSGGAPTGGALVTLGDNTSVIQTPGSTLVAQGSTTGGFSCTTVPVTTRFRRQVWASYRGITLTCEVTMEP